jgi:hypothetical protein
MIIYIFTGLIWTIFFEWILRNFSPTQEGLPTIRARIFHIILWPLAMFIVFRNLFNNN